MTKVVFAFGLAGICQAASGDQIDAYIRKEMAQQGIPGLALAIVRDGKVVKSAGYGIADLDNDVKVRTDTVFETASITKQFTATLILMLVQEGKLRLDDPISLHLPNPSEKWKDITVRHLLNNTSGMREGFPGISNLIEVSTEEMYAAVRSAEFSGIPGQKFGYSNVGFFLLGMIIEKITGHAFGEVLTERILRPLKMDSSRIENHLLPYKRLAKGYTLYSGPETKGVTTPVNIRRVSKRGLTAHTGLFSTVQDLAKWDAALHTESPLSDASKRQMWSPTRLTDGSTLDYGFGWYLGERGGYRYSFHGGVTGTGILRFPELKLSVIVLTNLGWWSDGTGTGASPERIVRKIATLIEPRVKPEPIADPSPALTNRARTALESVSKGIVAKEAFTVGGAEVLTKYMKDTVDDIRRLGEIRKFELVEVTRRGKPQTRLYRVTGSKSSELYAFDYAAAGLIEDFYVHG